jgi:hypothetical protein
MLSLFAPTTAETIAKIATIEIKGRTVVLLSTKLGINLLKMIPKAIGIIITLIIEINIAPASTGNHWSAKRNKINGVRIGASNVEKEVIATETGTSPLAKYTITLDAVPPGHAPTNTRPAASSGGKFNAIAIPKATSGIITNCAMTPIITGIGFFKTTPKSDNLNVSPIPNMIIPSNNVI